MFRLLLTAPFLAGSLAVGCASQGAGPEGDAPWVGAPAVPDPELEALLRPEEPLERTGLYHGKDGRTFYVAELAEEPPRGFLKAYESLLRLRGVLVEATYPSPHDLPPRVEGYRFLVFTKGDTPVFSLKYRQFYDSGGAAMKDASRFASVPSPFNLQGRTLALSLGEQPSREWKEVVLVPEEDVLRVKELPFGRYPNAKLRKLFEPEDREDLLEDDGANRFYAVQGASIEGVLQWYAANLGRFGLSVDQRKDSGRVSARSRVPVAGITYVSVRNERCGLDGLGMAVDDLRKRAPRALEDFPSDAICFQVIVSFATNVAASEYWTEGIQALRRSVLSQEK